jgi:hypothetical protein
MQIDGIQLTEGSDVTNLTLPSGATFPSLPSDGELYYVNSTSGGNTVGLYVYSHNLSSWQRQLDTTAGSDAGSLSGNTLASNVIYSSLTSFGTLSSLDVSGTITAGAFSGSGTLLTGIPNSALTNYSLTIGSTNVALGATTTTLAGLASVTATSFVGALTGHASLDLPLTGGTLTGSLSVDIATVGNVLSLSNTGSNGAVIELIGNGSTTPNKYLKSVNGAFEIANSANSGAIVIIDDSGNAAFNSSVTGTNFIGAGTGLTGTASALSIGGSSGSTANLTGGTVGAIPFQSAVSTTSFLTAGTSSQVLIGGTNPAWSSAPAFDGSNLFNISSSAVSGGSITIGSTNISVNGSTATLAGLTSVTSAQFNGPLNGLASSATTAATASNILAGSTGALVYQSATNTTNFISAVATGQVLMSGTTPTWTANPNISGTLTAGTFSGSGASLTSIPNSALVHDSVTIGSTNIVLGSSTATLTGLTSVSATIFTGALTGTASGNLPLNGGTLTGALILAADPTVALGAATKAYVDNVAAGINIHPSVVTATTTLYNISPSTYTAGLAGQSPDTGTGVGAYLQATGNGPIGSVGNYPNLAVGDRILVKNQANYPENGIYVLTDFGSVSTPWKLTRASDYDNSIFGDVIAGDLTYVTSGDLKATQWVQTTVGNEVGGTVRIGSDAIVLTQFSGAGASYTAGTGIDISSNIISNTGVTSITTSSGLSTNTSATGDISITNTGVTSAIGGTNISVSSFSGDVTFSVTGTVPSATNATNTINIAGGAAGSLPYQGATGTTNMLTLGTTGYILTAGASTPIWTDASTASIGTATNIAGGAAGSLPYQSAAGTTAMLSVGTNGQILTLVSGVPSWQTNTSGVTSIAGTANQITASASTGDVTLSLPSTITGLTSVTSTNFVGNLTGNVTGNVTGSSGSTGTASNVALAVLSGVAGNVQVVLTTAGPTGGSSCSLDVYPDLTYNTTNDTLYAHSFAVTTGEFVGNGGGLTDIPNASLSYSSFEIGNTVINLGDVVQSLSNMTSVGLTNSQITNIYYLSSNTSANQVIDAVPIATTRTSKYLVQVTSGTSYQACEILVMHDGTSAFITEYGDIYTAGVLATFDATVSSGNLNLVFTPTNAVTKVSVVRTSINVL